MIEAEERKTTPLKERIDAARKCQEKGYPLGFHFDPIIYYEQWRKNIRNDSSTFLNR